jgi:hypothetical protein
MWAHRLFGMYALRMGGAGSIVRESRKIIRMREPAYDFSISAASSGVEFHIHLGSDARAYSRLGQ